MTRREMLLPAAAALAVLGLAGAASAASRNTTPTRDLGSVAEQIRDAAERLEWPILPSFLTAVAYTESRFSPQALNKAGRRGVFQLLASSALVDDLAGYTPERLFEVPFAVVAGAYYSYRLAAYRGSRRMDRLTGLDIRRGWAYPTLVDDYAEEQQRSREVRARLEQAERATGSSVANQLMFPPGWSWIGAQEALRRVGAA